jgi:hypothetical protein
LLVLFLKISLILITLYKIAVRAQESGKVATALRQPKNIYTYDERFFGLFLRNAD